MLTETGRTPSQEIENAHVYGPFASSIREPVTAGRSAPARHLRRSARRRAIGMRVTSVRPLLFANRLVCRGARTAAASWKKHQTRHDEHPAKYR